MVLAATLGLLACSEPAAFAGFIEIETTSLTIASGDSALVRLRGVGQDGVPFRPEITLTVGDAETISVSELPESTVAAPSHVGFWVYGLGVGITTVEFEDTRFPVLSADVLVHPIDLQVLDSIPSILMAGDTLPFRSRAVDYLGNPILDAEVVYLSTRSLIFESDMLIGRTAGTTRPRAFIFWQDGRYDARGLPSEIQVQHRPLSELIPGLVTVSAFQEIVIPLIGGVIRIGGLTANGETSGTSTVVRAPGSVGTYLMDVNDVWLGEITVSSNAVTGSSVAPVELPDFTGDTLSRLVWADATGDWTKLNVSIAGGIRVWTVPHASTADLDLELFLCSDTSEAISGSYGGNSVENLYFDAETGDCYLVRTVLYSGLEHGAELLVTLQ